MKYHTFSDEVYFHLEEESISGYYFMEEMNPIKVVHETNTRKIEGN
jgi:hypothetical protein